MQFTATLIALVASIAAVSAQTDYTCLTTTELRKLIPTCALTCQAKALAATGCDYEDVRCNCIETAKVQAVIEPCLADPAFSNCTADEVNAFAGVVVPICTQLNATTPAEIKKKCSAPSSSTKLASSTKSISPVTKVKTETFTTLCSTSSVTSTITISTKPYHHVKVSSTPAAPVVVVSSSSSSYAAESYPIVKPTGGAKPVTDVKPVWNATASSYTATWGAAAPTGYTVKPVAFEGAASFAGVASGAFAFAIAALLL
ncbi:hypothetical protein EJ08DRAFT_702781 [Tothia fuscella]|uniref:CFEM domain-containing protein n=1 Tax=Tothia fuscella TaxID=1048955 RepID=A0A9P4TSV1_9PEZI|nr:hypothetical protein EJ08DRAFT_702781 [Tothia fuscella]